MLQQVMLWDHEEDLDLWVYSPAQDKTVGWVLDDPISEKFEDASVITLNVDNYASSDGPERQLSSGTLNQVWINRYDDKFTQGQTTSSTKLCCNGRH